MLDDENLIPSSCYCKKNKQIQKGDIFWNLTLYEEISIVMILRFKIL